MSYKVKEEICLNSARTSVVSCDSPAAHFKLTPPFGHLEDDEAKALGLLETEKSAEKPQEKAVETAPQNKAVSMPKQGKK